MQFRPFAVLGLVAIVCGTSSGCYFEYQATTTCSECVAPPEDPEYSAATGEWSCSREEAIASSKANCPFPVKLESTVESRLTFSLSGECADARSELLPELIRQAGQRVGFTREPPVVEPADEPTCPPRKVDVKVTVFQAVPVPECPGDIEVEVDYQKYISEGVFEATTLSATVPVDGHHEFVCVDASVTEFGKVGTISVRVYSDLNCVGEMPLAIGQAYSEIPADGSRLEVRADLMALQFDDEILPPANATASETAPARGQRKLVPIPDPKFTSRSR